MLFRTIWNYHNGTKAGSSSILRRYITSPSKVVAAMAAKDGELRVFIVSGEVSGDTIGSRLMASLKKLSPLPVHFSGVGGTTMSKQGLKTLFPIEDIAVMGIWELLPHLHKMRLKLKETVEAALTFQPHVVVTVDSKGFSFRLLKQLRARYSKQSPDSPVHFHYVAPSFWAWKGGEARLKGLAEFVDHVLCILPNEEAVLRSNGLAATFVGHPILDVLQLNLEKDTSRTKYKVHGNRGKFLSEYKVPSGATVISLLPGSRLQEVTRMLPIFEKTIKILKGGFSELTTVIHLAPNQHVENYICQEVNNWPVPVILIPGEQLQLKYDAFSASDVALCTSGTVAIELQLARLPCVVAYRAHFLTEWFVRYKAKISYISLPNILLNSAIIPEAIFQSCTPTNLAALIMEVIRNEHCRKEQIANSEKLIKLLCPRDGVLENSQQQYVTPSLIAATTILNYGNPGRPPICR